MRKNSLRIVAILLTIAFLISACGSGENTDTQQTNSAAYGQTNPVTQPVVTEADSTEQESLLRDPEESKAENSGALSVLTEVSDGFSCEGDVYTITAAGTYTFSGVSGSGQIVVDAGEEKVEIIFNGVTLANAQDAPIKILSADKVTLTAAEGSYNDISDERALRTEEEAEAEEKAAGGAIYAKCDLTLAGSGTLVVSGSYNNGVHTTKDLKIKDLTLKVTAPNNALKGNDSVSISSGSALLISTGGDGIKTEDSDISSKGNQRGTVTISGGILEIYAACDGIDAAYNVEIAKGDAVVKICTDTYSPYTGAVVGTTGTKAYLIVTPSLYNQYKLFAAYFYQDDREGGVWAKAAFDMNCYSGRTTYNALSYTVPSGYDNVAFFVKTV